MPDGTTAAARTRGADHLWRAIERAGVTRVFSLSGNHVMAVYDAAHGSAVEIVHVRHEAAAVHMADAWARLTGEVGVALVTGGQGHTNAAAALPTALASEVPVVLLSGHAPLAELGQGAFQETPQVAVAAPLCKAAFMSQRTEDVAADFARACRIARAGRPGPVHLSLPTDVLEGEAPAPASPLVFREEDGPAPDAAALAAFLAGAERPFLAAGPSLNTPEGHAALAELEAATGLPAVMMESPRGMNDPALGDVGGPLSRADAVILLGKQLDFTLRFGRAAPGRYALIEPDPALVARAEALLGPRLGPVLRAAPLAGVRALASVAKRHAAADWAATLRKALSHRPESWAALAGRPGAPIHPATLLDAVQRFCADAVVVCDGGEIGQWAMAMLRGRERVINGIAGAIGAGIPFAIAASAARPGRPVVTVMGDGSAGFHLAEFDTAARAGLPFVAIVGNDGAWNAELQIQKRDYGADRAHGCTLAPATRYDLAAAALGAHGEFVERGEDLVPALERAFASFRPALVNVLIAGQPAPNLRR